MGPGRHLPIGFLVTVKAEAKGTACAKTRSDVVAKRHTNREAFVQVYRPRPPVFLPDTMSRRFSLFGAQPSEQPQFPAP